MFLCPLQQPIKKTVCISSGQHSTPPDVGAMSDTNNRTKCLQSIDFDLPEITNHVHSERSYRSKGSSGIVPLYSLSLALCFRRTIL